MFDLTLTAEQIEFRDTVRKFVESKIKPAALHPDRLEDPCAPFLSEELFAASRLGLRTLALPEALGGAGADELTACLVIEELAAGDAGIAAVLAETSTLARSLFANLMTPGQSERFLPQFLADDAFHLAFAPCCPSVDVEWCYHRPAIAESGAGAITARRIDGNWIIDGSAGRVANASFAKLFVVEARTDVAREPSRFVVPRETSGLEVREATEMPTWHIGKHGTLIFKDCRVPTANVLTSDSAAGALGASGTPSWDAANLGLARAAFEAALDYSKVRVQGGCRIIEHEGVGLMLADMAVKLQVARNIVWQAAWAADHPDAIATGSLPALPYPLISNAFVSQIGHEIATKAAEVFGAMGIMRDMPLFKYVRDAQMFLHAGDGNTATRLRIAETLDGYQRGPKQES